jgi:hypothetical protein
VPTRCGGTGVATGWFVQRNHDPATSASEDIEVEGLSLLAACRRHCVRYCIIAQVGPPLTATMPLRIHCGFGKRDWRGVAIFIVVCSLTFCLATRFWVPSTSSSHAAKSVDRRPVEPKRQHLDRDATQWVAPSSSFSIIEPAAPGAHLFTDGPLLPQHVFSDSSYNRPPPSSGYLL